jgi:hypothetical protein
LLQDVLAQTIYNANPEVQESFGKGGFRPMSHIRYLVSWAEEVSSTDDEAIKKSKARVLAYKENQEPLGVTNLEERLIKASGRNLEDIKSATKLKFDTHNKKKQGQKGMKEETEERRDSSSLKRLRRGNKKGKTRASSQSGGDESDTSERSIQRPSKQSKTEVSESDG